VYVKIPLTNTWGESSVNMVRSLARAGVKLNVTALLTLDQVRAVSAALAGGPSTFVSIFAGRIADTGRDPMPVMAAAVELVRMYPNIELIWASPRELLNVFQADAVGCHIITATNDILAKLHLVGKDLHENSLETVKMFRDDAVKAGSTCKDDGAPYTALHQDVSLHKVLHCNAPRAVPGSVRLELRSLKVAIMKCLCCGNTTLKVFSKLGRDYERCAACGMLQVPQGIQLTEEGLSIYESQDNVFNTEGNEDYYLDAGNLSSAALKVRWLRKFLPQGARVLDAGANYGHFLKAAEGALNVNGFDIVLVQVMKA
jgi:hypothetical protein